MMRIGDADLRIGAAADFPGQHERADAGQVGLVGQRQQVHHQLGVLGVVGRDADRLIDHRQLARVLLLGHLDAPLDVAHRIEVLGELRPCPAGRCGFSRLVDLAADEVEDALVALRCAPAARRDRCCRSRRTAARTPPADRSRSAAASSACSTRSCWCSAQLRRRRRRRASRSTRCRARGRRAAFPWRAPSPRSDPSTPRRRRRRPMVALNGTQVRNVPADRA